MALYSEKVMDHFMHPRNVGVIENADGVGEVGNAKCGDIMKMYLKIENDIIVGDTNNIKTHIASCCYPVPGDEIIGFITNNNGISIHRKNCLNVETLDEKGVQIISKDVKIETKRAGWTAHGELLLREAAVSLVDSRAEDTGAEDLDRNED